ncbi:hypothetical protein VTK26DRAFT_7195 [Humicola hyalothermophila]
MARDISLDAAMKGFKLLQDGSKRICVTGQFLYPGKRERLGQGTDYNSPRPDAEGPFVVSGCQAKSEGRTSSPGLSSDNREPTKLCWFATRSFDDSKRERRLTV